MGLIVLRRRRRDRALGRDREAHRERPFGSRVRDELGLVAVTHLGRVAADDATYDLARVAGGPAHCVGAAQLGPRATPSPRVHDDRVLVADHLAWRATQERPCASLLWFAGAHHPYRGLRTPFGEATLRDRYDNCIVSADEAVGLLSDGLAAQGRLDSTLLLVMGDHGEALGEHLDAFHGNAFYDHSIRIPCLLANPRLFPQARRCAARFSVRDLPATLLWLLGDERPLRQSRVLFANSRDEPLWFSNVYQDFKLGKLVGDRKYTFRPERAELLVHDLAQDPAEERNIAEELLPAERSAIERELVAWYHAQRRLVADELLDFVVTAREPELTLTLEPAEPRVGERVIARVTGAAPGIDVELIIAATSEPAPLVRAVAADGEGHAEFIFESDEIIAGTFTIKARQQRPRERNARADRLTVTIR